MQRSLFFITTFGRHDNVRKRIGGSLTQVVGVTYGAIEVSVEIAVAAATVLIAVASVALSAIQTGEALLRLI